MLFLLVNLSFAAQPRQVETGVYVIPLEISPSLESDRPTLEQALLDAQRRLRAFARRHGWERHARESFADRAIIFDDKGAFDRALINLSGLPAPTAFPLTYSAALEERVLLSVSPALYRQNYPDGDEDAAFEKLLAHEMAHRLHIRILGGNEEAMGPIWFYEGFACLAAGQFEEDPPPAASEVWDTLSATGRGNYRTYGGVIRHFLRKASLRRLVERAGTPDFLPWLRNLTGDAPAKKKTLRSVSPDPGWKPLAGRAPRSP